jgi:hypothetical protein
MAFPPGALPAPPFFPHALKPSPFPPCTQSALLTALAHPSRPLRQTCGTIISVLVGAGGLSSWPHLAAALSACLTSSDETSCEGGISTLYKIIEDSPGQLQAAIDLEDGSGQTTACAMLTGTLIALMQSPHVNLRSQAVACLNLLARDMPTPLVNSFDL